MLKCRARSKVFLFLLCLNIVLSAFVVEAKEIGRVNNKYYKLVIKHEKHYKTDCFIATIKLKKKGYSKFGTSAAKNKKLAYETTKSAAKRLKATLCVNCDYANGNKYTNARSKKVWIDTRGRAGKDWIPAIYDRWRGVLSAPYIDDYYTGASLKSLVKEKKVSDTFNFGWALLVNNKVTAKTNKGTRAQRTFIGTNGKPGHIVIIVTRGRYLDGHSPGLTARECGILLKKKGCNFGVMLDGGGSSAMVFKGRDISTASRYLERKVTDFIYLK